MPLKTLNDSSATALDTLIDYLDIRNPPPTVTDPGLLADEKARYTLAYQCGRRAVVDDLIANVRRRSEGSQ